MRSLQAKERCLRQERTPAHFPVPRISLKVSDLRQSRRLEGGGAAQGRRALRAMIRRLAPIQHVRLRVWPTANPNLLPAFFASPVRDSTTSPLRLALAKHAQGSSRHRHYPPPTLPEPSNFGSPPAEPEDFLWIKADVRIRLRDIATIVPPKAFKTSALPSMADWLSVFVPDRGRARRLNLWQHCSPETRHLAPL